MPRNWSSTGTQLVEVVATQLTVDLLMPMSGIGQAIWTSVDPFSLQTCLKVASSQCQQCGWGATD